MKKRVKLSSEPYFPKKIIGISSHFKDIQVAWALNNTLSLNLRKSKNFRKQIQPDIFQEFSVFRYVDASDFSYFLISNKNTGYFLTPKHKNFDFFLISNVPEKDLINVGKEILKSKMILGSFIISADSFILKAFNCFFEE